MKVMILGAEGNLGIQLCKIFTDYDLIKKDVKDIDFLNLDKSIEVLFDQEPDLVINAMAFNDVDGCEEDEEKHKKAKLLNIDIPWYLSRMCLEKCTTLVHYSSDYVFGGRDDYVEAKQEGGYSESRLPIALNKYSETKLKGEEEIKTLAQDGLRYYIIRTSKLFGPKGNSKYAKPSFFDIMLNLAKEKDEIRVVDSEESCFTYTPDLARATKQLVEGGYESGIYHLVNEGPVTWYEGVLDLFELSGTRTTVIPVEAKEFSRPAKRPVYSALANTKFPKLRTYKEALKEYISGK